MGSPTASTVLPVMSVISALSVIWFLILVFRTLYSGAKCQDNPWGEGADTLEWTTSSPPPFHTFEDLPEIK